MSIRYKNVITAISVDRFNKRKYIEGFTVLQLRINRFDLFELHAAIYNHRALALSNLITRLPYIKQKTDLTMTQKIFAKVEELFAESHEIVCGFKEKDVLAFNKVYCQFKRTQTNEFDESKEDIFECKSIKELLVGDEKPRDIINNQFYVTVDLAEQLAAILMDLDSTYYTDVCSPDLIRSCLFLLEQSERLGYDSVDVVRAALNSHEMEIGLKEEEPIYLRKSNIMVM